VPHHRDTALPARLRMNADMGSALLINRHAKNGSSGDSRFLASA